MSLFIIISFLLIIIGTIFLIKSKKYIFKNRYLSQTIGYLFYYTAIFIMFLRKISVNTIESKLDVFVTISATLAGLIFTGLAIILALIEFEHIKSLFKNNFLDNLFYRGYGSVVFCVFNIILYIIIVQYNIKNPYILFLNQYVLGISLLLFLLMLSDFIFAIKELKKNLNRK